MQQLECQQVTGIGGETASCYEVVLWKSEALADEAFHVPMFTIEVREVWEPLFDDQPNFRQVSVLEVESLGMAQGIYHYTVETLYGL